MSYSEDESEGSVGSLADFLVEDDDVAYAYNQNHGKKSLKSEARELMEEFPFDKALLTSSGRPRRVRKPVERYQDPDYVKLMVGDDVSVTNVFTDESEGVSDDNDEDYESIGGGDDDDDDEEEDDESIGGDDVLQGGGGAALAMRVRANAGGGKAAASSSHSSAGGDRKHAKDPRIAIYNYPETHDMSEHRHKKQLKNMVTAFESMHGRNTELRRFYNQFK